MRLAATGWHALRHAHASALIAAGAPITEVQHRLGHGNASITLKVYWHHFELAAAGIKPADRVEPFFGTPLEH
jgi:integrase